MEHIVNTFSRQTTLHKVFWLYPVSQQVEDKVFGLVILSLIHYAFGESAKGCNIDYVRIDAL